MRICVGPGSASRSTISSPVVSIATRGRTNTCSFDLPTDAASAIAVSLRRVPRSSRRLPRLASAPCATMFSPGATPLAISTRSPFCDVYSHPSRIHGQTAVGRLVNQDQSMPANMIEVSNAEIYALLWPIRDVSPFRIGLILLSNRTRHLIERTNRPVLLYH